MSSLMELVRRGLQPVILTEINVDKYLLTYEYYKNKYDLKSINGINIFNFFLKICRLYSHCAWEYNPDSFMYQANILRYDHFYYITFNIPRVINGKGLNMFRGDAENVIYKFFHVELDKAN